MAGPDIQDGRQQRPKWGRLLPVVLKGVKWDISDISGRASKRHFAPGADIRVGREDASLNGRDWVDMRQKQTEGAATLRAIRLSLD